METQKEFFWLERKGQEGNVRMRAVWISVLRPEGQLRLERAPVGVVSRWYWVSVVVIGSGRPRGRVRVGRVHSQNQYI